MIAGSQAAGLAVLDAIARQQDPRACRRCGRPRDAHRDATDWRYRGCPRYRPRKRKIIFWRRA